MVDHKLIERIGNRMEYNELIKKYNEYNML
jgi:hypothetical protein